MNITDRRAGWIASFAAGALLASLGAWWIGSSPDGGEHVHRVEVSGDHGDTVAGTEKQLYVCPMMCVAPQPEPGRCPVCGMDLVPQEDASGGKEAEGAVLVLSESARMLAEIRTEPVVRRFADIDLRLSGKIDYDETRVREISAWVAGRLERIFVDQTGTRVRKGDPLVEIYSEDLNAEKASYLAALRGDRTLYDRTVGKDGGAWLESARARLRLRGMTTKQIEALEGRESPSYTEEILAPIGGTVIHKSAMEGMHVQKGAHLYTVADLSRLWVWLDAYESDIPFLRYGQTVELRTESYGDRVFQGRVSFIDPFLNESTRTIRVRVIVENKERLLKPNMFVRARIGVRVGEDGQVLPGAELAGKWISPRHPEILRDAPGTCPVCGIDLVRAEDLGYATAKAGEPPLLVPASAVLFTGTRSLVYMRVPGKEKPTYEGVEIEIGPRAGQYYVVLSGLKEGDEVVAEGAFAIDSALQVAGKPSMMLPQGGRPAGMHQGHGGMGADARKMHETTQTMASAKTNDPFRQELAKALKVYFAIQAALAKDHGEEAKAAAKEFQQAILGIPLETLTEDETDAWTIHGIGTYKVAGRLASAESLQKQRRHFQTLSESTEALLVRFGPLAGVNVYRVFCPMAFDDEGAAWLQSSKTILNPYEGSRMPHCGTVKGILWEDSP